MGKLNYPVWQLPRCVAICGRDPSEFAHLQEHQTAFNDSCNCFKTLII
jgi:hypothetical protein